MNNFFLYIQTSDLVNNEIILSQGFSFESFYRGVIGMISLVLASNGKFSKTISPKKTLKKETVFLALALLPVITKTISKQ